MDQSIVSEKPLWLRVLQFPLTRIFLLGSAIFFMMTTNNGFMEKFKGTPLVSIAVTICMALLAIAIYVAWGRLIERRPVSELSLAGMGREWATGALIGAGLIATCVLILIVLGMYRIEGFNPISFLLPAVAMVISSGTFEELFFRGILFRSVEDLFGSWIAVIVSSLIFGFVHLLNPEGTIVGAIYISIEAGLLLAAAYLITRRLWIGIGLHMAWNYTLSAIFSGIVSGGVSDPGLIKSTIEGPDFLTGGSFGLESSILALILCTSAGIVLMIIAIKRGHVLPPPWKR
ncbi:CPBP family intramembrane glutamic endopeptidase [Rhizobium alvei]|uniref:CPBP family intramembrane metalloprotease n=1 Tax=Rhizobium alvei TaxID=1132659 RepID=A0ABT8YHH9_9HYPH|nr:CPBP family intramembrane glutamic endopeptidase [Rhizobium alvei]MDO6963139.1 CPBP family intramembrane metalloprotease [Rhizobium alvei]